MYAKKISTINNIIFEHNNIGSRRLYINEQQQRNWQVWFRISVADDGNAAHKPDTCIEAGFITQ